jgi:hypothetical protein
LQRNDKLKKWVMVAMKGGSSDHGIPGGYFSDAFARAAVKKAIKADKEGRKADKEGRKAALPRLKKSYPRLTALKTGATRLRFFPLHPRGVSPLN